MSESKNPVSIFNNELKTLARIYKFKKKGTFDEADAHRDYTRVNMLIKSDSTFMINIIGPYLVRYGESIQNNDIDELINTNYDEEKKNITNSDDIDKINKELKFVKDVISESTKNEKNKICDILSNMLNNYCLYELQCRGY